MERLVVDEDAVEVEEDSAQHRGMISRAGHAELTTPGSLLL